MLHYYTCIDMALKRTMRCVSISTLSSTGFEEYIEVTRDMALSGLGVHL